uniref:Uncharacterized protein n=1 Tax=Romanomermis culicivorax TaxID=13658 RepID=A0A915J9U8_ROMCU
MRKDLIIEQSILYKAGRVVVPTRGRKLRDFILASGHGGNKPWQPSSVSNNRQAIGSTPTNN